MEKKQITSKLKRIVPALEVPRNTSGAKKEIVPQFDFIVDPGR